MPRPRAEANARLMALRRGLSSDDPATRRAARWALDEDNYRHATADDRRLMDRRGVGPDHRVAAAWAARYRVDPSLIRPLLLPRDQRPHHAAPLRVRITAGSGFASKQQGGRAALTGTALPQGVAPLTIDRARLLMEQAVSLHLQGAADAHNHLLPSIRYWTAACAVRLWLDGADVTTYPRRGYRKGDGLGWWYGPSDVHRVRADAVAMHADMLWGTLHQLYAMCGLYAVLHPDGSECACMAPIRWALAPITNNERMSA